MKELLDAIISALDKQQPVVIVTIIASSGSTPRGAGATMAVFRDGSSAGTIGGGAVEYAAQQHAAHMFSSGHSHISSYELEKNDVADLGMICGGDVTVYYEYVDAADKRNRELLGFMRTAFDRNVNSWVVRRFGKGSTETAVFDDDGLHFAVDIKEGEIRSLLGNAPELTEGEIQFYTEPLTRTGKVYVFGGGHVARELVPVLSHVGFSVDVYEDREKFAKPELFPGVVNIILHGFDRISEKISISDEDFVVVMTRGHQMDFEVLDQVLRTPARYVGCIGSSRKVAATKERLIKAGVAESAFERLYSPIGLRIKADTPAEIAISIAAEMIKFRAEN